jgi:hypothetical protein
LGQESLEHSRRAPASHARPKLMAYSAVIGAANRHMFRISAVGVMMAATMMMTRTE